MERKGAFKISLPDGSKQKTILVTADYLNSLPSLPILYAHHHPSDWMLGSPEHQVLPQTIKKWALKAESCTAYIQTRTTVSTFNERVPLEIISNAHPFIKRLDEIASGLNKLGASEGGLNLCFQEIVRLCVEADGIFWGEEHEIGWLRNFGLTKPGKLLLQRSAIA